MSDTPIETSIRMSRIRQSLYRSYPYLLLLVISVPALTLRLDVAPPLWFDEGYKLNAARTLAERGVYGTYTIAGYRPFDPGISSGPLDILAVALSFSLWGVGVIQARLPGVFFSVLALFSLYSISRYIYGSRGGLFVTLLLLAIPEIGGVSFLFLGRQALGEMPSLGLIMLGLWWWFRVWDTGRWSLAAASGLALGFGLLSKMQTGIALLPALLLVLIGRWPKDHVAAGKSLAPIVIMLGVVGSWSLLGWLVPPEPIRQDNSVLLLDAIQSNLLTGLFGRTLTASALGILTVMGTGVFAGAWRLKSIWQRTEPISDLHWAEATLTLFGLCSMLWFAFLSVGWPRYAFAGLTTSMLLVGKLAWDVFQWGRKWIGQRWPGLSAQAHLITMVGLATAALVINLNQVLRPQPDNQAQQMAEYIRAEVPRNAVVESWEWELDALSSHWEYHHPDQRYLFLAIRQFSHERKPFDLDYDVLQADPDYLIMGPFSDWTHIYDKRVVEENFVELAEIGVYRIYKRIRR